MDTPSSHTKPELKGEFVLKKQNEPPEAQSAPPEEKSLGTYELIMKKPNTDSTEVPNKPQERVLIKHTLTPFTALSEYPAGLSFIHQEKDETVILLIRKHFVTNIPWIFVSLLLMLLPPLIIPIFPTILPFLNFSPFTYVALIMFYYLVLFGFSFINFSIWYFHAALVTDRRIVDIDITGILFRHVAETKLTLVQDVSYQQYGVIRSIFNFGDVMVQTAGTEPNFEFDQAPNPAQIVKIVTELIGKSKP